MSKQAKNVFILERLRWQPAVCHISEASRKVEIHTRTRKIPTEKHLKRFSATNHLYYFFFYKPFSDINNSSFCASYAGTEPPCHPATPPPSSKPTHPQIRLQGTGLRSPRAALLLYTTECFGGQQCTWPCLTLRDNSSAWL